MGTYENKGMIKIDSLQETIRECPVCSYSLDQRVGLYGCFQSMKRHFIAYYRPNRTVYTVIMRYGPMNGYDGLRFTYSNDLWMDRLDRHHTDDDILALVNMRT